MIENICKPFENTINKNPHRLYQPHVDEILNRLLCLHGKHERCISMLHRILCKKLIYSNSDSDCFSISIRVNFLCVNNLYEQKKYTQTHEQHDGGSNQIADNFCFDIGSNEQKRVALRLYLYLGLVYVHARGVVQSSEY